MLCAISGKRQKPASLIALDLRSYSDGSPRFAALLLECEKRRRLPGNRSPPPFGKRLHDAEKSAAVLLFLPGVQTVYRRLVRLTRPSKRVWSVPVRRQRNDRRVLCGAELVR